MKILEGYDRQRAIDDGVLIDVSESIARDLGLTYPVAVSAALWNHPEVLGDPGHLQLMVQAGTTCPQWWVGLEAGEFSSGEFPCTVVLDKVTYAGVVNMRVIFEPSKESGIVATLIEEHEVLDLRCPRMGSLYPM